MTTAPTSEWAPWTPPGHLVRTIEGPEGRRFDILVRAPDGPAPEGGWPGVVVLDGDRFFGAVSGAAAALAQRPAKTGVGPLAVIALAYRPERGVGVEDQRARDFTRFPCAQDDGARPGEGGEAFLRFLTETALPAAQVVVPLDRSRLSLFGHSLAGLFVLETLEARPDLFARWISLSPSLWWRTPDPAIGDSRLLVGCGEAETRRDMRGRIQAWATRDGDGPVFRLAPAADHGSTPFALIPDALRHGSSD